MCSTRLLQRRCGSGSSLFRIPLLLALLGIGSVAFGQNEQHWTANIGGGVSAGFTPLVGTGGLELDTSLLLTFPRACKWRTTVSASAMLF